MLISLARLIRKFRLNESGAPAVEFALIAPVMILFYLGCSEICQAVIAKRKVIQAADSIADLVTRDEDLTAADISAIRDISDDIMFPLNWDISANGNDICIQYYRVQSGTTTVYLDWDDGCSGVSTTAPSNALFPTDESSLLRVTMTYTYTSAATSVFMPNGMNFSTTAFYAPRDADLLTYN